MSIIPPNRWPHTDRRRLDRPGGVALVLRLGRTPTRQRGNGVLETVTADGLIRQRLTSGRSDVREPVWSPFERF